MPCENCKRAGRACTAPAKSTVFTPVFVGEAASTDTTQRSSKSLTGAKAVNSIRPSLPLKGSDHELSYFFTTFMPMNVFVGEHVPIAQEIMAVVTTSLTLRDAIQAIAILHRGQHYKQHTGSVRNPSNAYKEDALNHYGQSVRSMQQHIASMATLDHPSTLWVTFLLGMFEVCIAHSSCRHLLRLIDDT